MTHVRDGELVDGGRAGGQTDENMRQEDRQCMCNIPLGRVPVTIVAVEKQ